MDWNSRRVRVYAVFLVGIPACVALMLLAHTTTAARVSAKTPVPADYVAAADALAFDDYAKAKSALTALANVSSGSLKVRATAAADAPNISAMRIAFRSLSELVSKMALPPGHSLIFCPMFEKGSYWVQRQKIPVNPYMGQAMLSCGDIVKTSTR